MEAAKILFFFNGNAIKQWGCNGLAIKGKKNFFFQFHKFRLSLSSKPLMGLTLKKNKNNAIINPSD